MRGLGRLISMGPRVPQTLFQKLNLRGLGWECGDADKTLLWQCLRGRGESGLRGLRDDVLQVQPEPIPPDPLTFLPPPAAVPPASVLNLQLPPGLPYASASTIQQAAALPGAPSAVKALAARIGGGGIGGFFSQEALPGTGVTYGLLAGSAAVLVLIASLKGGKRR